MRTSLCFQMMSVAALLAGAAAAWAGAPTVAAAKSTANVVMLSDIHFDPYEDPGKFDRLRTADISTWASILASADSVGRDAAWTQLRSACGPKGDDASFGLMQSALAAARARQPHPAFVTVSGDLMAHEFDCRFHKLAPHATDADYAAFAAKTTSFVARQVRAAFPHTPVFLALGNNDSGCGDYRETVRSQYLHGVAPAFAQSAGSEQARRAVLASFDEWGNYSVPLPAPIVRGRIIVLQDDFGSRKSSGCDGKPNPAPAADEVAWLRDQLAAARTHRERVWVMAHIPPGIDVYATVQSYVLHPQDLCAKARPTEFLASTALADALTDYADVVALAVFGHTHADALRIISRAGRLPQEPAHAVAAKLIASISPNVGNHASVTIAQVRTGDAVLADYTVVIAQGPLMTPTAWAATSSFRDTYHVAAFTPTTLTPLIEAMRAHQPGSADSPAALAYERAYMPGDNAVFAAGLDLFWPAWSCGLDEDRAPQYWKCVCPAQATPPPAKATP